jgi:hypothetical protein
MMIFQRCALFIGFMVWPAKGIGKRFFVLEKRYGARPLGNGL